MIANDDMSLVCCNLYVSKHDNVYFLLLEEDEEEEEEIRGKIFPFDKLIIPGKHKVFLSEIIHQCVLLDSFGGKEKR